MRFFGAYGPYEAPRKITTRWLQAMARGQREFVIRGDGKNLIDFMYVDDAVDGFLALVKAKGAQRPSTLRRARRSASTTSCARWRRHLGVDVTVRHEGTVPEYIEFRSTRHDDARSLRRAPSIAFDDGLQRLRGISRRDQAQRMAIRVRMSSKAAKVVILGAGPAGISAAWRLTKLGYPVTVLERDDAVGGMGRTIKVGDYSVDFGPHTFHIRETAESKEILKTITPFFGDEPADAGARHARAAARQGIRLSARDAAGAVRRQPAAVGADPVRLLRRDASSRSFAPAKKEDSFEEWGVRNLGRTLYDLCFGIYSARVWGLPTSQISSKQAQRVAKLNLKNIILRTLGIKADPTTYFTKYFYPRQGISQLYEGMAAEVRGGRQRICC